MTNGKSGMRKVFQYTRLPNKQKGSQIWTTVRSCGVLLGLLLAFTAYCPDRFPVFVNSAWVVVVCMAPCRCADIWLSAQRAGAIGFPGNGRRCRSRDQCPGCCFATWYGLEGKPVVPDRPMAILSKQAGAPCKPPRPSQAADWRAVRVVDEQQELPRKDVATPYSRTPEGSIVSTQQGSLPVWDETRLRGSA